MGPAPLEECPASGSAGGKNWDSESHSRDVPRLKSAIWWEKKSVFISSLDIKLVKATKDCGTSIQNLYDWITGCDSQNVYSKYRNARFLIASLSCDPVIFPLEIKIVNLTTLSLSCVWMEHKAETSAVCCGVRGVEFKAHTLTPPSVHSTLSAFTLKLRSESYCHTL